MRASRLFLAAGVLGAGVCAAWPFRLRGPAVPLSTGEPLVADVAFRRADVVLDVRPLGDESPAEGLDSPPAAALEPPTTPRPDLSSLGPAPELPIEFGPVVPPPADWQPPRRPLATPTPPARQHRLTDGDSLELLAQRYLGSTDRALEIFEANRDVLRVPDILPLGRVIRIPSRAAAGDLEPTQVGGL
ncbi:MAG: tail protein X [Pirellulaceae bacterium]|nr:tail protein X [Pirellulaceae bacterium]